MDWITIIRQGQIRRVRPHGLAIKQSQGWVPMGADQETPQPKAVGEVPKAKTSRKKQ